MQALPALTTQVQLLTDRQLSLETQFCQPTPLPRSQLENPLSSAMPTVGKPNLSKLAKAMPSPPRTQPQQPLGMLAAVLDKPAAVVELETEKEKQDMPENSNLAQAVLAQSQALTALVSQIASVSQDPMNDLTSMGATAGTRGAHAGKGEIASGACPTQRSVLHRSASSHVPPDGPYFQLRHHTTTDASSRNLRNQVRREIRRIWEDERMGDAPIPGDDRFGFSGGQHQCGEGHSGTIGGDFCARSARSRTTGDSQSAVPAGGCSLGGFHEQTADSRLQKPHFRTSCGSKVDHMCIGLPEGDGCDHQQASRIHSRRRRESTNRTTIRGCPNPKPKPAPKKKWKPKALKDQAEETA